MNAIEINAENLEQLKQAAIECLKAQQGWGSAEHVQGQAVDFGHGIRCSARPGKRTGTVRFRFDLTNINLPFPCRVLNNSQALACYKES